MERRTKDGEKVRKITRERKGIRKEEQRRIKEIRKEGSRGREREGKRDRITKD